MKTRGRAGQEDTDALLASIGTHVREEQKDDALFESIARGDAAAADREALEARGATDGDVALRLAASQPLGADVIDRITERALGALQAGAPARVETPVEKPAAKVVPISWARRLVLGAGPLALAAGLLLYVVAGPKLGTGGADLPTYGVTASGAQEMRGPGEHGDHLRLARGKDGRFELVLRPATAPPAKVVAFAFAVGAAGGDPSALDAKIEVAPEGAVRITGRSSMLEGASTVRVVVGAPDAIGKYDDALALAKSGSESRGVRVITVPIDRE